MSILCYLRNSLADSERMNIQPNEKNSYPCSLESLKNGSINQEITLGLFERYGKNIQPVDEEPDSADKNKRKKEEVKFLSVFIYPLKYKRIIEYGKRNRVDPDFIYPLCLPAALSREGVLSGDLNLSPFISRRYLSPQSKETAFPEISSVSDQDDFFTHNVYVSSSLPDAQEENRFSLVGWDNCWIYAEKLWKCLADADLRDLEIPGYALDDEGVLLYCHLPQTPSLYLMQLYDILREKKPSTPLLKSFLSQSQEKEKKILKPERTSSLVNERLMAQMNLDRPLSYSQNIVMNHFLDNKKDLFLTVNGPPGTGKTTLIQSLIANIWVQAALDQTDPPLIVATSTNNNAVTNVLESFKTKNNVFDFLCKRWLPDIHSFGTYCGSSAKIKKEDALKQGWLITEANQNIISYVDPKTSVDVESLEYLDRARVEFKRNFEKMFDKTLENLSDIIEFLHKQLSQAVNDIKSGCNYQKHLCVPFDKSLAKEKSINLEEEIHFWLQKHKNFRLFEKGLPFYLRWGRYLLMMRKLFGKAEERRFKEFYLHERLDNEFQNFYSESVEDFIIYQLKKSQDDLKQIVHALKIREKQEQQWQEWCLKYNLDCKPENLSQALNHTPLRSQIFYLATHYWEAKWLQDMEKWVKQKDKTQIDPKQVWLRRAKLSPCFVSTLYMLPRFFRQGSSYLYNFIDYLIFDESGQINSYVAAPSLALAKRAVIVGDTKQLEPIHNIPDVVDQGNCKRFHLIDGEEQYKEFTETGFAATYNSLMNRAHYLCDFKQAEDLEESGFLLREHWRCVPEIASYCNELAYNGCLEPKRSPLKDRFYPALGYAHIPGTPEVKGESRCNPLEAQVIGTWLKKNEERIRQCYGNKPLHEIVAIITPFKPQSDILKKIFNDLKLARDITIGTVHSLQGAERPLIIFSPTYGESDSLHFVDRKVNFFNVALSRAKDSFLIFGNMAQFNTASATPSGLLARKLFAHEENEIVDIDATTHQRLNALKVEFVDNLERHRGLLKQCIQEATKRVLIVSPYISINAINDDNLETLIGEAVNRGTEVAIITDHYFDERRKLNTEKGREKLEEAGAVVNIHRRIHDKVICVDDHTLVSGSFNWLSATRINEYAKEERSTLCKGGTQVSQEINKHWKRIGAR